MCATTLVREVGGAFSIRFEICGQPAAILSPSNAPQFLSQLKYGVLIKAQGELIFALIARISLEALACPIEARLDRGMTCDLIGFAVTQINRPAITGR